MLKQLHREPGSLCISAKHIHFEVNAVETFIFYLLSVMTVLIAGVSILAVISVFRKQFTIQSQNSSHHAFLK